MFKRRVLFCRIIFVALGLCISMKIFAAPLNILEFKKTHFNPNHQHQICTQVQNLCEQPEQWRSLITPDHMLWLLSGNDIAVFKSSEIGFKLFNQWSVATEPSQDEYAADKKYIYPKLFPMNQNRYAVAVINSHSEMYSGGGATIERADFYELLNSGQMKRFIQDYPFGFNRMIRACFSERDYEVSKGNCHDEDQLSLEIQVIKPMLWQFGYRYRLNVSPASDSTENSHKGIKKIKINLDRPPRQPNIFQDWNYAGQ